MHLLSCCLIAFLGSFLAYFVGYRRGYKRGQQDAIDRQGPYGG